MTALVAVVVLAVLLVAGAAGGSRLLHRLGEGLSVHPRLGIGVWTAAAALWVMGALALGPLLAWTVSGPGLPGPVGSACRRCLAAANPFGPTVWTSEIPTFAVLVPPIALALVVLLAAGRSWMRSHRALERRLRALSAVATRRVVQGTTAWVVPGEDRVAYAMPGGGGVVLSQGTIDGLAPDQLAAVVAHERAHLDGRHHLVLGTLRALGTVFGWVPLVGAAGPVVAGYAEMAADDAARRTSGTRALAGALLALQGPGASASSRGFDPFSGLVLHAGRYEPLSRVRRLAVPAAPPSRAALALVTVYLSALCALVLLVAAPYLTLGLTGSC